MDKINKDEVMAFVDLFYSSEWMVAHLEIGDHEIYLSKDPNRRIRHLVSQTQEDATTATSRSDLKSKAELFLPQSSTEPSHEPTQDEKVSQKKASAGSQKIPVAEKVGHIVRAPSLGTFYRAPKPGADMYVNLGDRVDAVAEVCLVEVMKLFTTVLAGATGVVSEIFVEDGELVEYDQALFVISIDRQHDEGQA